MSKLPLIDIECCMPWGRPKEVQALGVHTNAREDFRDYQYTTSACWEKIEMLQAEGWQNLDYGFVLLRRIIHYSGNNMDRYIAIDQK